MKKYKPFIMYANYSQFKPEEIDKQKLVKSRMLLWCIGGESVVVINGHSFNMRVGDCIITPWEFKLKIDVKGKDLFNVAAIHIIPNMKKGALRDFKLGGATSPQGHLKYREYFDIPNFDKGFIEFKIFPNNSLSYLIHHIIAWFSDQKKDINTAEFLAHHLISEIIKYKGKEEPVYHYSKELKQMLSAIDWRYKHNDLTLEYLMQVANCSKSTVFRLFKEYLNTTPACKSKLILLA